MAEERRLFPGRKSRRDCGTNTAAPIGATLPLPANCSAFAGSTIAVIIASDPFGFRNQPPLSRRLVPKHFADAKKSEHNGDFQEWRLVLAP